MAEVKRDPEAVMVVRRVGMGDHRVVAPKERALKVEDPAVPAVPKRVPVGREAQGDRIPNGSWNMPWNSMRIKTAN